MSDVWWCNKCQVPLLTPRCEACGSRSRTPFARDVVPVFREEHELLRNRLGLEYLPKRPQDFYLWSSGSYYYRLGARAAKVRFAGRKTPEVQAEDDGLAFRRRPTYASRLKQLPERLGRANRRRLEEIEHEAVTFIQETVREYDTYTPLVAFSGGKDSVVVSELVCRALGTRSILHMMADTTIEIPATYEFLETFQTVFPHVPLLRVSPQKDFVEMSRTIGPPSRILRWCCTSHKKAPMATVIQSLARSGRRALTFDGIRAKESFRRRKYDRITEDPQIKGEVLASPIREWTDLEVWSYILWRGLPINEGYRYGLRRIGCLYCPFNGLWSRYLIRVLYPDSDKRWQMFLYRHAVEAGHPDPEHFAQEGWRKRAGGRGLEHGRASVRKEVCLREERTYTYRLFRPWSESFWEYMRPFGTFSSVYDDGMIERGEITDRKTGSVLARVRISKPRDQLRISFADRSNGRLFLQRFERQVRKYQSCVLCGGCEAACPVGAISVNGSYRVMEDKCFGCLECVSAPCVAVESLTRKGATMTGRPCNGAV